MTYNNFNYSEKHNTFRCLVNVYNYLREDLDVIFRGDYKIIVTDYNKEKDIINIPDRVSVKEVQCHFVDNNETILMIELILKDLNIEVKW